MKEKRRHIGIIFILLVLTSLFMSSCGFANYCSLEGIKIKPVSSSENNKYLFEITGTNDNLSSVKSGPSVLLVYVPVSNDYQSSDVLKALNAEFNVNNINSHRATVNKDDYSVCSFDISTDGGETNTNYKIYTFKDIKPWQYCLDLTSYNTGSSISGQFEFKYDDGIYSINGEPLVKANAEHKNIMVFAAVVVQPVENNDFTNVYWTSFVYLGDINENIE